MIESPPEVSFSRTKRERKSTANPQRRQLVYSFIVEYRSVYGYSPLYPDIAEGAGYSRTAGGTAHSRVMELVAEGWLTINPRLKSRNIYPAMPEDAVYCKITDPALKRIAKLQKGLKILK